LKGQSTIKLNKLGDEQIQTLSMSGDLEGYAVPTTHVTLVVLFGLVVKVAKIS